MGYSLESWFSECGSGLMDCVNAYFDGMAASCDSYIQGLDMARIEMGKGLKMVADEYAAGVKSINQDYLDAEKAIAAGIATFKLKRQAAKEAKEQSALDKQIADSQGKIVSLQAVRNKKLEKLADDKKAAEGKLKTKQDNFLAAVKNK
jgi:wyosine [tRNA(Phe)-imidazoG37] synthetase (radical SAM superfamily)